MRAEEDMVLQEFLSGWFLGAPFESIRRGNALAFAAYAFYGRSLQQLPLQVRPDRASCMFSTKLLS